MSRLFFYVLICICCCCGGAKRIDFLPKPEVTVPQDGTRMLLEKAIPSTESSDGSALLPRTATPSVSSSGIENSTPCPGAFSDSINFMGDSLQRRRSLLAKPKSESLDYNAGDDNAEGSRTSSAPLEPEYPPGRLPYSYEEKRSEDVVGFGDMIMFSYLVPLCCCLCICLCCFCLHRFLYETLDPYITPILGNHWKEECSDLPDACCDACCGDCCDGSRADDFCDLFGGPLVSVPLSVPIPVNMPIAPAAMIPPIPLGFENSSRSDRTYLEIPRIRRDWSDTTSCSSDDENRRTFVGRIRDFFRSKPVRDAETAPLNPLRLVVEMTPGPDGRSRISVRPVHPVAGMERNERTTETERTVDSPRQTFEGQLNHGASTSAPLTEDQSVKLLPSGNLDGAST